MSFARSRAERGLLPMRALNCLAWALGACPHNMTPDEMDAFVTPDRVSALSSKDLIVASNLGKKTLSDIRGWLAQRGLTLADEQ